MKHFQILNQDGSVRHGRLSTRRGDIETPCFMPVATRGAIKALPFEALEEIGYSMVLSNTYHLHLRPGEELVHKMGGLHRFMTWKGPILTDSGGFQVFSLARLRKIEEAGVFFNSHIDGQKIHLTPEKSMEIQWKLDSDVLMAFDVCPPLPGTTKEITRAVSLTSKWAARSQKHLRALGMDGRLFFAINQGGLDTQLRHRSLNELLELEPHGLAIGGLSVGETLEERVSVLDSLIPAMPDEYPRYLMGVGTPVDFLEACERGVDLFDCVMPTRVARHGACYTSTGRISLKNKKFELDDNPIDEMCGCKTCRRYSRGYLRHLFSVHESAAQIHATHHNLHFFFQLMAGIRQAIATGTFQQLKKELLPQLQNKGM